MSEPSPPARVSSYALFEVSWEVCNKVGGIYTVVASKAKTMVERLGDDYAAIGPWLLGDDGSHRELVEEPGHEVFVEECRAAGMPIRVGRWQIPGQPRVILVEFSGLLRDKDAYLARLWERFHVDSLHGNWDYLEPVLFGRAAGMVVERWWRRYLAPLGRPTVLQAHEWLAGSALLQVRKSVPAIGTVFTTHATMLGRALASTGQEPLVALADRTPEQAAAELGVPAKHSLEGVAAREADVFTTVSGVTAQEAERLHYRRATPILPNGIDVEVIDRLAGVCDRDTSRRALQHLAGRFLGCAIDHASLVGTSGRYEFINKGFDVLLEAAARVNAKPGRPLVLFLFVPAGVSGPRLEMLADGSTARRDPSMVATHHLFDPDNDPIQRACTRLHLTNGEGSRVKVIHVPIYLHAQDGVLDEPYESVIRALDLTCFPSFYEPWGLTPAESLALGLPTVTTDSSGFGRWMEQEGVGEEEGLYVLARSERPAAEVIEQLTGILERVVSQPADDSLRERCRSAAARLAWSELAARYFEAFEVARDEATRREDPAAHASETSARPTTPRATPRDARPRLRRYEVSGSLPPELDALRALAHNYAWTWDATTRALFEDLSPKAWAESGHNPVRMLRELPRTGVAIASDDRAYAQRVEGATRRLAALEAAPFDAATLDAGLSEQMPIAYFCLEFGIASSLHLYSGGLGILAGDHLKSASDLGLPLVGLGLYYHRGYLSQQVSVGGDQQALPESNEPDDHAVSPLLDEHGDAVEVLLPFPGGTLALRVWRATVGKVVLYLLDTDVATNRPDLRRICDHLYGGDTELRIQQEIVLGRGGVRLLRQLGLTPAVVHLNEGHAAFAPLERVARLVRDRGLTFHEARELVRASTVFTTHTPIAAGHDRFPESLVRRYFSDVESWLGLPWERFWGLGTSAAEPHVFSMTRLALRLAEHVNGVSRAHGRVSRHLLSESWPSLMPEEVPLAAVTNGVHLPSWVAPEIRLAMAAEDRERPRALWHARKKLRRRFLESVRERLRRAGARRGEPAELTRRTLQGLEENALMVGFARRFAPYKRADLLLREPRRLRELLDRADRPIRLFLAGKAHPQDGHGQDILRTVARAASGELAGRLFFLENYDIELATLMVQGCDVWLNTPTRPLEASGTSGMKAAANGVPHVSALDGWWAEGWRGDNGWAIRAGEHGESEEQIDDLDCGEVLQLLEHEIAPMFFDRGENGFPAAWVARAERSIAVASADFSAERMVGQYRDWAYLPAARRQRDLREDTFSGVREVVDDKRRLRRGFSEVAILDRRLPEDAHLELGERVELAVVIDPGPLAAADLVVELVVGPADSEGALNEPTVLPLNLAGGADQRPLRYEAELPLEKAGRFATGIRVRPHEAGPPDPAMSDLAIWA